VLNRINEVGYKFCSIRLNVTKYDVTFATKERILTLKSPPLGDYATGSWLWLSTNESKVNQALR